MPLQEVGVRLTAADAVAFNRDLEGASKSVTDFGSSATSSKSHFSAFGEVVTGALREIGAMGVRALKDAASAVVDLGKQSLTMSADFEQSMSMIRGLTETSTTDFTHLGQQILDISKDTNISAKDLADASYFIASAGHTGSASLEILTEASHAAASGLGSTVDVADAVTSALNAYKLSADEAGRVTDVMTNIVIQGKTAPDELAGALGRVMPIAAAAGVSFEQVAASVATMTKVGLNADESVTALRGVLGALIAPGKQATEALDSLGLTTDELRTMIREKGLLMALQELMDRTGGNVETLDLIIPNVRALTGVLATASSQSAEYTRILGTMENAEGRTDAAFQSATQTFQFQYGVLINNLKTAAIEIGVQVLPMLTEATKALIDWLKPTIASIVEFATELLKSGDPIDTLMKKINEIFPGFSSMIDGIQAAWSAVSGVIQSISNFVRSIVSSLTDFWRDKGQAMWANASGVWGQIQGIIQTAMDIISGVVSQALGIMSSDWDSHGITLMDLASSAWDTIHTTISDMLTIIQNLLNVVLAVIQGDWSGAWVAVQDTINSVWTFISDFVSDRVTLILDILRAAGVDVDAFGSYWTVVQETVSGVINGIWTVIQAVLTVVRDFLRDHGEEIKTWASDTWDQVAQIVSDAWSLIQIVVAGAVVFVRDVIVPVFDEIAQFIRDHSDEIYIVISGAWESVSTIITITLDAISSAIRLALQIIHGDWEGAWDTIQGFSERFVIALMDIIDGLVVALVGVIVTALDGLDSTINAFADGIIVIIDNGMIGLEQILDSVTDTIYDIGMAIVDSLWGAIVDEWNAMMDWIRDAVNWITDAVDGVSLGEIGNAIIDGLKRGMEERWNDLIDWISDVSGDLVSALKDAFGIASPSKVMAQAVGSPISQGIATGIDKGSSDIFQALQSVASSVAMISIPSPQYEVSPPSTARPSISYNSSPTTNITKTNVLNLSSMSSTGSLRNEFAMMDALSGVL